MKFRAIAGLLTVAIIVLFALVVKFSFDLNSANAELKEANRVSDSLRKQSDSLLLVTEDHLHVLAQATDSVYFDIAKKQNSFNSYKNYIVNIGSDAVSYDAALVNMTAFFPKKGSVQITESSGNQLFTHFKETDNFPPTALNININGTAEKSVAKNNLFRSKSGSRVRGGVIGNPDYPNSGSVVGALRPGQMVKVLDTIASGDAYWVYISFGDN